MFVNPINIYIHIQFTAQNYLSTRPRPGSFNAPPSTTYLIHNSASTGSIAPPPSVPPRRHSETREILAKDEPDLISFNAAPGPPTMNIMSSDTAPAVPPQQPDDSHSKFLKMVGELHK